MSTYHYRLTYSLLLTALVALTMACPANLSGAETFRQWKQNQGIPTADFYDDFDKDGIPALLEFALGLDPHQPDRSGLPSFVIEGPENVYRFTIPTDRDEIAYLVELTTDFANWKAEDYDLLLESTTGGTETYAARYKREFYERRVVDGVTIIERITRPRSFFRLRIFSSEDNLPPEFKSLPPSSAEPGKQLLYEALAVDPDGDHVTYALLAGPANASFNENTGALFWIPTSADIGTHTVLLRATDTMGASALQGFSLTVAEVAGNRPPRILSSPDRTIPSNQIYTYDIQATDPDQDVLTYALVSGPAGASVNPASGMLTWSAQASASGAHAFEIAVSDGKGATVNQAFSVAIESSKGNLSPFFTSDPVLQFSLPSNSNPPIGQVSPASLTLPLAPGETTTETVSIELPVDSQVQGTADIIVAVDQSGSMIDGQAWIGPMVAQLEQTLLDSNIGPNRYALNGFPPGAFLNAGGQFNLTLFDPYATLLEDRDFDIDVASQRIDVTALADGDVYMALQPLATSPTDTFPIRPKVEDAPPLVPAGFDTIFSGNLAPDEIRSFPFTASAGSLYYLDILLPNNSQLRHALVQPDGTDVFSNRPTVDSDPELLHQHGDYELVLQNTATEVLPYRFRLLTSEGNLASGERLRGKLRDQARGFASRIHTVTLQAGDRFYVHADVPETEGTHSLWLLTRDPVPVRTVRIDRDLDVEIPYTGEYVYVLKAFKETGPLDYDMTVFFNSPEIRTATFNMPLSGVLPEPGMTRIYTFEGTTGLPVYFDGRKGSDFRVEVVSPSGRKLFNRSADGDWAPFQLPESGQYRLYLSSTDTPGPYEFSFLNLASAQVIPFGTPVSGSTNANVAKSFRIQASAGQRLFLDPSNNDSGSRWALYDPGTLRLDDVATTLPLSHAVGRPGDYLLILSAHSSADPFSFDFTLTDAPELLQPLSYGQLAQGTIGIFGERHVWTVTGQAGDLVMVDATMDPGSADRFKLFAPDGTELVSTPFLERDVDPFVLPIDGTYSATLVGEIGFSYTFRILRLQDSPISPLNSIQSVTFSDAREVFPFKLAVNAGDTLAYVPENEEATFVDPTIADHGPSGFGMLPNRPYGLSSSFQYILLAGDNNLEDGDTVEFSLTHLTPANTAPSGFNTVLSTVLPPNGSLRQAAFSAKAGTLLYVDFLEDHGSDIHRILYDPDGEEVLNLLNEQDPDPFLAPVSGTYEIEWINRTSSALSVAARILDLDSVPVSAANTVLSGISASSLDPAWQPFAAELFRFHLDAGDRAYLEYSSADLDGYWRVYGPGSVALRLENSSLQNNLFFISPQANDYFLLLHPDEGQPVDYQFTLHQSAQPALAPIDLDQRVDTTLLRPGQAVVHTIDLNAGDYVYFDGLLATDDLRIEWRHRHAEHRLIPNRDVTDDYHFFTVPESGTYTLSLNGAGTATGNAAYRIHDATSNNLFDSSTWSGSLDSTVDNGLRSEVFYFDAVAGERVLIERLSGKYYGRIYSPSDRLYDLLSNHAASEFEISVTGRYGLALINAGSVDPFAYDFSIRKFSPVAAPLSPGGYKENTIDFSGQVRRYTFQGSAGEALYWRSDFSVTDPVSGSARLFSPAGDSLFTRPLGSGLFSTTLPHTGTYTLEIDGLANGTGAFAFLLNILSTVPVIDPDNPRSLEGTSVNDLDFGRIPLSKGQTLSLLFDEFVFGTAQEIVDATANLRIDAGGQEDGYISLDQAIQANLREEAAASIIAITDEDRDVIDSDLTFSLLLNQLIDRKIVLNTVVLSQYEDGLGNDAFGLDSEGNAFLDEGGGAFSTSPDGRYVGGFGTTKTDYVDLAWGSGGASWSIEPLQDGGDPVMAFTNAFVSVNAASIIEQLDFLTVLPSDPTVNLVNLTSAVPNPGSLSTVPFDIEITGDGTNRTFDLLFVRPGSGLVEGSIPVSLVSDYQYDANAADPDGDALSFSFAESPAEASIDPFSGIVSFFPADGPGTYPFRISVSDGRGGFSEQTYSLDVVTYNDNQPPVITSDPPERTGPGRPYQYRITAEDPEAETILYNLISGPEGMSVDLSSGLLTWVPEADETGVHPVEIRASDSRGAVAFQSFNLFVIESLANEKPSFTSSPPTQATVNVPYTYSASATDPDGDSIALSMSLGPDNALFDPDTGHLHWTPAQEQQGGQTFILKADDQNGGIRIQTFNVDVRGNNQAPVITSEPPLNGEARTGYLYEVVAVDPESDVLEFSLESPPSGMSIDPNTGRLVWNPTDSDVGTHSVTIFVDDFINEPTRQDYTLLIEPAFLDEPPVFTSNPRELIAIGKAYRYRPTASDPENSPLHFSLMQGPTGMTLTAEGMVMWTPAPLQLGSHSVTVRVSDGAHDVDQAFDLQVLLTDGNEPPEIRSSFPPQASPGQVFRHQPSAEDPEGDPFNWELPQSPQGMTIDPHSGHIDWVPDVAQIGSHTVVLRVVDAQGGFDSQTSTITVDAANLPPAFLNEPSVNTIANSLYTYEPLVSDPENAPLVVTLPLHPSGMAISPTTGIVTWTPAPADVGLHDVILKVTDPEGAHTTLTYTLAVQADGQNELPQITSTPTFVAFPGELYAYQLIATDVESPNLVYAVTEGPSGLTVDPSTGFVSWTPTASQLGLDFVTITATDDAGDAAWQRWSLTVIERTTGNRAPVFRSGPENAAAVGILYELSVLAYDPDGDPITFALESAPPAMSIDANGNISWLPEADDAGTVPVIVAVSDPFGATSRLSFDLPVLADDTGPSVSLSVSDLAIDLGESVQITASASDPVGIDTFVVTYDNQPIALDANGQSIVTPDSGGTFTIAATATDLGGNSATREEFLIVTDPANASDPLVLIESPAPNSDLTEPVEVFATIQDSALASYELTLAPAEGDGEARVIATGTAPASNEVIGTLDPTLIANGVYRLTLTATNLSGFSSSDAFLITLSGDLKIGHFQASWIDLNIPLAGIPIQINRVYDSLGANRPGSFGFGWRLDIAETSLRTTIPNAGQLGDELFRGFRPGTRVFVTLPGGKRVGFTFEPELNNRFFPIFDPAFTPDPGVRANLYVDRHDLRFDDQTGEFQSYIDRVPYNPASPVFGGHYRLVTAEGLEFRIQGVTGQLETLSDLNGNSLLYTDDGIFASSGKSIAFERDSAGRITEITDPSGETLTYSYDSAGNLVSFTDREENTTTFAYHPNLPHFLTDITDPLGRPVQRNEYDADGRLIAYVDIDGEEVSFSYDPDNSLRTIEDSLGNQTTLVYDPFGNVVQQIDPKGNLTQRTYDVNNALASITDPLGNTTTFSNDEFGFVEQMTDPLGNTIVITYAPFGRVKSITDALGNTMRFEYDGFGNRTASVDALGFRTTYVYDLQGNVLRKTDPLGTFTEFSYDADGNQLTKVVTDHLGTVLSDEAFAYDNNNNLIEHRQRQTTLAGPRTLVSTFTYDAEDRLRTSTDPENHTTTHEYDANGNLSVVIDPLSRRFEYEYTPYDSLEVIRLPSGTESTNSYDSEERWTGLTGFFGRNTRFEYDALDRLSVAIYPDDSPADPDDNPRSVIEYDEAGRVVARVNEDGHRTRFVHDRAGRIIAERNPDDEELTFIYDAGGRLVGKTDPLGRTTTYLYDAMDNLLETRFPDNSTIHRAYDARGRLIEETDQAGRVTRFEYNGLDQLTAVVDALNQRIEYTCDELGNRLLVQEANGVQHRFTYDGNSNQTGSTRPWGIQESKAYDGLGNLLSHTTFNNETITYAYDELDRMVTRSFSSGRTESYSYGDGEKVRFITTPEGAYTFAYDVRERLQQTTIPASAGLTYTHDKRGNVTSITGPSGTSAFAYDGVGRLASVTHPDTGETRFTYDPADNLVRIDHANGLTEIRSYDILDRLTGIDVTNATDDLILSLTYELDPTGLRLRESEGVSNRVLDFEYDALKRLTRETLTVGGSVEQTIAYTYDAAGNRQTRSHSTEGLTIYTYDAFGRLVSESLNGAAITYQYDDAGNIIERFSDLDNNTLFSYDAENRLTGVVDTADGLTSTILFSYDPEGNRIAQTIDGQTTHFLVDTSGLFSRLIEELDDTLVPLTRFEHAPGFGPLGQFSSGEERHFFRDALGTIRLLTDDSGAITDSLSYDAFGNLHDRTGTTDLRYGLGGEQFDESTGLYYLRARYMDPAIGRFLSADPFAGMPRSPLSFNKYLYAHANPVNMVDPTGLFSMVEVNAVNALIATINRKYAQAAAPSIFKIAIIAETTLKIGLTFQEMGLQLIISDVEVGPEIWHLGHDYTQVAFEQIHVALGELAQNVFAGLEKARQNLENSIALIKKLKRLKKFLVDVKEFAETAGEFLGDPDVDSAKELIRRGRSSLRYFKSKK